MTLKFSCIALFILYSFSEGLAQQAVSTEQICSLPASAAEKLFAASKTLSEKAALDAVLLKENFRSSDLKEFKLLYKGYWLVPSQRLPLLTTPDVRVVEETAKTEPKAAVQHVERADGFDWNSAFRESLLFLSVQHSLRLTQAKNR